MGSLVMYFISMKWLWDPHVEKFEKNIMGMHRIIEQMGKVDQENPTKIVILEKWLIVTSNWRCYGHPLTSPNMGANLTSFECHELVFHTHHKSLHQIDENQNALRKYP
jgi:hypothetical protein